MADDTDSAFAADLTKTTTTTKAAPPAPALAAQPETAAQPQATAARAPVDTYRQPPDIAAEIKAYGSAETDEAREAAIKTAMQKLGDDTSDKRGYVENELRRRGMLAASSRGGKKAA